MSTSPHTDGPRVSVVIPMYNSAKHLGATIDSVVGQTYASWELVVQDDGSSDGSVALASAIAEQDPARRIRVVPGDNVGVAAARNRGYAQSDRRSELVIFLDHDDVWEPTAIEVLVAALDRAPAAVASHAVARCIDDVGALIPGDDLEATMRSREGFRGRSMTPYRLSPTQSTTFADLALSNWILTPGLLLVRRCVVDVIGGFDPQVVPADDWDFGLRVSRMGELTFAPHCLLNWRRHDAAQSNLSGRWRRAYFDVRTKMLLDPANSADQRVAARTGFRYVCLTTAREAATLIAGRRLGDALRKVRRCGYGLVRYTAAETTWWYRRVRQPLGTPPDVGR